MNQSPPNAPDPPHYGYIDAMRGWAVIGVIASHLRGCDPDLHPYITAALARGALGVQLFFIVSAYTLFLSLDQRAGCDRRPIRAFFLRRVCRIVPLYWGAAAFYLWWSGIGGHFASPAPYTTGGILRSLVFVTAWEPMLLHGVVPGGWSVNVEMNFYILVPVLWLALRGPRRCAVFLWASLFVAAACVVLRAASRLYGPPPPNPFAPIDIISLFAETWLPAQLPAFALGLLVYRASRAQDRGQAIGFLAIGSFAFVVSALPGQAWLAPVAGLAMAVWGASRYPVTFIDNRLTRFVGRISFSGYVTHFFATGIGLGVLGLLPGSSPHHAPNAIFQLSGWSPTWRLISLALIVFPLTILLSTVTYYTIERPGIAAGRWLIRRLGWGGASRN